MQTKQNKTKAKTKNLKQTNKNKLFVCPNPTYPDFGNLKKKSFFPPFYFTVEKNTTLILENPEKVCIFLLQFLHSEMWKDGGVVFLKI